jgi:hypothetical protein
MICRYCGTEKKLVKAHIIPEGFFRRLRDGQDPPRLLTNKLGVYPKKAPIGEYDDGIICGDCEAQFGEWDGYAQELLAEEPKGSSLIVIDGEVAAYQVQNYEYDLLKLFFVSLIWRASVSTRPFYARIQLGPFEVYAKNLIECRDPGSEDEFSVTLAKFDHPLGGVIYDPFRQKYDGVNYCTIYLGSYVAYVKTDRRKAPEPISKLMIRPNRPLLILKRNLERSQERFVIRDVAATFNRLQLARTPHC